MAVADILVSGATMYTAPFGESLPDETSVAFGASWGGNWTDRGELSSPVVWNASFSDVMMDVQGSAAPVKEFIGSENHTITTTLAEFTGANLALGLGGTNTDTAAGASQKGYSRIQGGGNRTITHYAVGFEGYREDSVGALQPIRLFFFNATVKVSGSISFDKNSPLGTPITVKAYADLTNHSTEGQQVFEIHYVTAPTT